MREDEQFIAGLSFERAVAYNERGERIFTKAGSRSAVSFTEEEAAQFKDAILTHNHPAGSTLSDNDVRLAFDYDIAAVRAVSKNAQGQVVVYEMRRPKTGWDANSRYALEKINSDLHTEFEGRIRDGKMTVGEANRIHWDTVWDRFSAAGYGIYSGPVVK